MAREEDFGKRRQDCRDPGAAASPSGEGPRDDGCVHENGQGEVWLDRTLDVLSRLAVDRDTVYVYVYRAFVGLDAFVDSSFLAAEIQVSLLISLTILVMRQPHARSLTHDERFLEGRAHALDPSDPGAQV